MLKTSTFGMALIINILMICLWHFASFILSRSVTLKNVDYRKFPYRAYNWERRGSFYSDNFDVGAWYGALPIKYNRDGIDYRKIESADIPKLKSYITVTCRSELCSIINCLYFFFALMINVPYLGFIIGIIVVIMNLPFIMANRFARFILLNEFLRKRKAHEIDKYISENNSGDYRLSDFE